MLKSISTFLLSTSLLLGLFHSSAVGQATRPANTLSNGAYLAWETGGSGGIQTSVTEDTTVLIRGFDTDASNYVTLATITAADEPTFNIASSSLRVGGVTLASLYQPLDTDLTSWALITRASGFDTFATTPSHTNFAALVTGETGTGNPVFHTSPTLVTPVLGVATATSLNGMTLTSSTGTFTLTNAKTFSVTNTLTLAGTDGSTLNVGTGGTLGTAAYTASTAYQSVDADLTSWAAITRASGFDAWVADPSAANFAAVQLGETGTGNPVLQTSPTLVTPALGTPSAAVLTNATGLPISTGLTGAGTGVITALGQNVSGSGSIALTTSPSFTTPALGTPSAAVLTNATGLPITTGVSGLGTGIATALTQTPTGTGVPVLATSPTLVTPVLGVATGTTLALTPSADSGATLTITTAAAGNRLRLGTVVGATTYGAIYGGTVTPAVTNYAFASDGLNETVLNIPTGGVVQQRVNGTTVTAVSSTGLAVTGTLSATGAVTGGTYNGLTVTSSTGTLTVPNGTTLAGNQNVSTTAAPTFAEVNISAAAGTNRPLDFQTAGVTRWYVATTNTAESGSNVGSDFAFYRYDDAGAYVGPALTLTRSTGNATFSGTISSGAITSSAGISGTTGTFSGDVSLDDLVVGNGTVSAPSLRFTGGASGHGWYRQQSTAWTYTNGTAAKWNFLPDYFVAHSTAALCWTSGAADGSADLLLYRGGAGILEQRVTGSNRQRFHVYRTYTNSSNYEYANLGWNGSTDEFELGTVHEGTGVARALSIATGNTVRTTWGTTGTLTHNYAAVFNEAAGDYDFRWESQANANAVFFDASSGHVGIGGDATPYHRLTILSASGNTAINFGLTENQGGFLASAGAAHAAIASGASYEGGAWYARGSTVGTIVSLDNGNLDTYINTGLTTNNVYSPTLITRQTATAFTSYIGSTTFNENGGAYNFRVETDSLVSALSIDGTNNKIGIGRNPAGTFFDVYGAGGAEVQRIIGNATSGYLAFYETGDTLRGWFGYGDNGEIFTGATTDSMNLRSENDLHFGSSGNVLKQSFLSTGVVFNENGADLDFRVESDTNANAFVIDGTGAGSIGFGVSAPFTQFANYASNVSDAAGYGAFAGTMLWRVNGAGYTATFENANTTSGTFSKGVLIKTGVADSGADILNAESAGVNRLRVRSDGLVNVNAGSTFSVSNTAYHLSNYERVGFSWSGNVAYVQNQVGGTGTARPMVVGTGNNSYLALQSNSVAHLVLGTDGHFVPNITNTNNLGSASNRWANGYFHSNVDITTSSGAPALTLDAPTSSGYCLIYLEDNNVVRWKIENDGSNDDLEIEEDGTTMRWKIEEGGRIYNYGIENSGTAGSVTIASGVATCTKTFHKILGEGAASDDLATITISGVVEGDRLTLRSENSSQDITVKDGTGNIQCGGDRVLDNVQDTIELIYDGSNWLEVAFANNGAWLLPAEVLQRVRPELELYLAA